MAEELIQAKAPGWRNRRSPEMWRQSLSLVKDRKGTLKGHCQSIVGLPIDAVTVDHVLGVLRPIWIKKHVTASRVRERIELVMNAAKARGHRTGNNPADWDALKDSLPRVKHRKAHHPAMPAADVPAYVASLRARSGVRARALEFTILTAMRTTETRGAVWSEIDLAARCWTIPAARMKADRDHRIPLSARAVAILQDVAMLRPEDDDGTALVFPGARDGKPLAPGAMLKPLALTHPDLTVHGFRASFRTWAQTTRHEREVAEMALAHVVGDDTERAYARHDLFEKRRALMDDWCRYVSAAGAQPMRLLRRRRLMVRRPALAIAA